ncbi:Rieske 2Fe-2S domain-containing protein [Alphaproteobacteria bacterium]|nr:Rieske 2Fe-2S domain-containing protein [Alphaproteobacteria bacterium]|tara:strand:+ start:348 stop:716 length:369 start_codon:yes stop_codon:yes gene_type:complete
MFDVSMENILTKSNPICSIDSLILGEAKSFSFGKRPNDFEIFIVCSNESKFYAYLNNCPHQHIPLDFKPGVFLNRDKSAIQCSTHGAQFNINNGLCFKGPCSGKYLISIPISIKKNMIYFEK